MLLMGQQTRCLEGEELETVDITVRLGKEAFEKLTSGTVEVDKVWLTDQKDGTYAIGVQAYGVPAAPPRRVKVNDARERT